jgi:anhydro-N-acetylmuramic acid kinase
MAIVIGLMSGTSADGIDAALVQIEGSMQATRVQLRAFHTTAYSPGLREAVLRASDPRTGTVDLLCRLNAALGEAFAAAAIDVAARAGLPMDAIDLIGSHGQTVHHLPAPMSLGGYTVRASLQLGEPCVIAERTGVTTVADFRPRDLAAGGEGAPLAPYAHYLLFRDDERTRVVHNIGGISNVTVIPAGGALEQVYAFDTGPGNMPIDAVVGRLTGGRETCDRDGQRASRGRVCHPLLEALLAHPYLARTPPKSTGRETFGDAFLDDVDARAVRAGIGADDLVATVTAFAAATMLDAYRRFILPRYPRIEIVLCGGGSHNPALVGQLREGLSPAICRSSDDFGFPADGLEAVIFAVLAYETAWGHPTNVPTATGAQRPVILGKMVPGRDGWTRGPFPPC